MGILQGLGLVQTSFPTYRLVQKNISRVSLFTFLVNFYSVLYLVTLPFTVQLHHSLNLGGHFRDFPAVTFIFYPVPWDGLYINTKL